MRRARTDGDSQAKPLLARHGTYRSGFAFGVLSFMSVAVAGVVSTVLTSRLYGVRIIGEFALVSVPVATLFVLSTVKEQQALIREVTRLPPRHPRVTQLFAAVFSFSAALTVAVSALAAVLCWFIFRGPLREPELVVPVFVSLAGFAIVTNTGWNIDSILSAFVAGRQIFWVRLHETLSFILIATALGIAWRSVWGLVIATIGASASSLVHRVIAVRPFVRWRLSATEYRAGFSQLPQLLRFGVKAAPGQVAQGISQQAGVWVFGALAPIGLVGAYSRAQTVPQRLQQASMRVTEVLYPTLVGRRTKGDGYGFDRALIDSIRYEMMGLLLIASVVGGSAHAVLEVFGPGFSRATGALALLMLYPALASITTTQTQALWATDRPGSTSVIAAARLLITMILLLALTPSIGIIGPPIALLVGYVTVVVLSGIMLRRFLTRPLRAIWPRRERVALAAAYAAGFATAMVLEHATASIAALPLCFAAGGLAYAAVFLACGGINGRDRERLSEALDMVSSRRKRRGPPSRAPARPTAAAEDRAENRELVDSAAS